MFILVVGNPVEGIRFIGPFESVEDANDHGDMKLYSSEEWWVASILAPD